MQIVVITKASMYKKVDDLYLKERIVSESFTKSEVMKVGLVKARMLKRGEVVNIYFYDENAQIQIRPEEITQKDLMLVTKTMGSKEYNSIFSSLEFCKKYSKSDGGFFTPLEDPFSAYEADENITFINCWGQTVNLCPGDFIVPKDASLESFYAIYRYNFDDNYKVCDPDKLEYKTKKM